MTEKRESPGSELLGRGFRELREVLRSGTDKMEKALHEVGYRARVSSQEHKHASQMLETFTGEAMDYLHQNPSGALKPVRPDLKQARIIYSLLDHIENGTLGLKETLGRLERKTGHPYLVKVYKVGQSSGDESPEIALTSLWWVDKDFPFGLTISGMTDLEQPETIMDFIVLPKKAQNPSKIKEFLEYGGEVTINVDRNGERINIKREQLLPNQKINQRQFQYHLIGSFRGQETRKEYWLYASNPKADRQLVTTDYARERQLAPQKVRINRP